MSDRTKVYRTGVLLGLLLLLLVPAAAVAQSGDKGPGDKGRENIRLTFRLGRIEDGTRTLVKSYDLILATGTPGSTLLSGARVPIPVSENPGDTDDAGRRFVYQNIGFTLSAEVRLLDDEHIRLTANLEDSRIREKGASEYPTVETRQLTVNAVLAPGKPIELTRVENPEGASGYVEVEAQVLH